MAEAISRDHSPPALVRGTAYMCTWRAPHVQCAERQMLAQHTSGDHVAFERHHTRFGARLGRRGPCKRKLRRRLHHSLTASLRRAPHEGSASVLEKKVRLASQLSFMIREHELAVFKLWPHAEAFGGGSS